MKLMQLEIYFRIFPAVFAQHHRQGGKHARTDEPDSQIPQFSASYATRFFHILFNRAQGMTSTIEECFAGAGKLYRARGSQEQRIADDVLQLSYLLRKRWLREMEPRGGASKV